MRPLARRLATAFLVCAAVSLLPALVAGLPARAGAAPATGKLVIAHRGASGYLPEHTLPAYAMAYALGADYIELDLVMTRDHHFIALHDLYLEPTTDVATLYPKHARSDGRWYAADFTLAEIERLRVHERTWPNGRPALPGRFPLGRGEFRVPTLKQAIELVQGLNTSTGCQVGLYLELKAPAFHAAAGLPMEQALLDMLGHYGYEGPQAHVFIESFDAASLRRLRALGSRLPLVQLIGANMEGRAMLSEQGLKAVATYANAIGPAKRLIEIAGSAATHADMVPRAHALGLQVHAWTFRADHVAYGYPDLADELRAFYGHYGVDGVFTDQPDRAVPVARGDPRAAGLASCPR